MSGVITFICWEKDELINIQLEPWAIAYEVKPGNEIKFVAKNPTNKFHWSLRIDHHNKGIQLFPESFEEFGIVEVYINEKIIDSVS